MTWVTATDDKMTSSMSRFEASVKARARAAAERIALRLTRIGEWDDDVCTFRVASIDDNAERSLAGSILYQGTAGIGLFLSSFARLTERSDMHEFAEAVLKHAHREAAQLGLAAFGYHSGRTGVAYALAIHGIDSGEAWALKAAREVLEPLYGRERRDSFLDVIGGAAGAIPALIDLAYLLDEDRAWRCAIALGEHLIDVANRQPQGWSWGRRVQAPNRRDINGLAHGAAGCAVALMELAVRTGEAQFRYAAERGVAYEQYYFDESRGNWPDFRSTEWAKIAREPDRRSRIIDDLRKGRSELPDPQIGWMDAWCHGASGIGLSRLRMFELTGDAAYLEQANAALATSVSNIVQKPSNASLCHGSIGNSELLLEMQRAGHASPEDCREVYQIISWMLDRYDSDVPQWPCGLPGNEPEPSLLLGDSGTGYFLLRVISESVKSVLLVRPSLGERKTHDPADYKKSVEDDVLRYLNGSIQVSKQTSMMVCADVEGPWHSRSPVLNTAAEIVTNLASLSGVHANHLKDIVSAEIAYIEAILREPPLYNDSLHAIQMEAFGHGDPLKLLWMPTSALTVHISQFDWDKWFEVGRFGDALPAQEQTYYVCARVKGIWRKRRVGRLAYEILMVAKNAGQNYVSGREIIESFVSREEWCGEESSKIRLLARAQLVALAQAGCMVAVGAVTSPSEEDSETCEPQ